jgi:hypothetical protein
MQAAHHSIGPPICAETQPASGVETAVLPTQKASTEMRVYVSTFPIVIVLGALALVEVAAASMLADDAPPPAFPPEMSGLAEYRDAQQANKLEVSLWMDRSFIAICLIGSVFGGALAIGVLPADSTGVTDPCDRVDQATRRLCVKGACSAICGILFTPSLMVWWDVPFTDINLMGCCGAVAFVSVGTIKLLTPYWERGTKALGERWTPKP